MIEGGVGTYAADLVRGLDQSGVDIHVITRGEKTYTENKTYRLFISNRMYWRRLYFIERAVSLFRSISKVEKFDVVHLNGTYPYVIRLGIPTVSTLHAYSNLRQMRMAIQLSNFRNVNGIIYLVLKTPVGSLFDLTTTEISDRLICPSDSLARDIMTSYLVDAEKIRVVPNGINLEALEKTKSSDLSALEKYGVQEGSYLLYIGRLSCFKGIEYLIEAFEDVKKEHKHLKLVIVGRGDFEGYLRRIARNDGNIVFTGHIDSLPLKKLLYEASLAVVLPSTVDEVFPLVVLEAMACSKPVIGTNVGGVPLLIRHGKSGFLVAPKNSKELAKFIKALCGDSGLRRKMGMSGRNIVERDFTVGQMVNKTLKIYESMLA